MAGGAGGELGPADTALFAERPELGQQVVRFLTGAYEQGVRGPLQDYGALGKPWPASIDVSAIRCRCGAWPAGKGGWHRGQVASKSSPNGGIFRKQAGSVLRS